MVQLGPHHHQRHHLQIGSQYPYQHQDNIKLQLYIGDKFIIQLIMGQLGLL